jgi:hypothetical protein
MNKRLILLISLFAFIVFIIVLSSTVFSFNNAQINFLSTTNNLTENEQSIIETADFNYGESIFFMDRQEYINNLEKANPYIKVVSLEVVFPSEVIVHAVERVEFYSFKLSDNTYAITDNELKVLNIKQTFINTNENAILVHNNNLSLQASNVSLGSFIDMSEAYASLIENFSIYSQQWDQNIANLMGNIKSITLNYETNNDLLVEMRQGVQIIIKGSNEELSDKMQLGFSVYDSGQIDRTQGIILVLKELDGEIVAAYESGE